MLGLTRYLPFGVMVVLADGSPRFANQMTISLLSEEWHTLLDMAMVQRILDGESVDNYRTAFRSPARPSGGWLLCSARPVAGGGAVIVLQEVDRQTVEAPEGADWMFTRQLETLQAPGAREEMVVLRALEESTDGIWDWNIRTGEDYLSPRWKAALGYTPEQLPNTVETWLDLLHPEDVPAAQAAVNAHLKGGTPYDVVLRYRRGDSGYSWMRARGLAVRDADGEAIRMIGTHTDVSELVDANRALRESQERYRQLAENLEEHVRGRTMALEQERNLLDTFFQSIPDATVISDADRYIQRVNLAFTNMFGFTEDEVRGTQPRHLYVDPEAYDEQGALRYNRESISAGEAYTLSYRRASGEVFPAETSGSVIRNNDGSVYGYIGVIRDLTGAHRMQDALMRTNALLQRRNDELERYVSLASHDLQSPLRRVVALSQLLEDILGPTLDDDTRQIMTHLVAETRQMRQLIRDLLSYSRVSLSEPDRVPVSMDAIVRTAMERLKQPILDAGAQVTIAEELPVVMGDEGQLVRVVQNLIGNAIKYRDLERTPQVSLSWSRRGADEVVFQVRDNGIGIDPRNRERIFGIFERLHASDSRYPGTGIGLAICQRVVEQHGGTIWVTSEPGVGSCFSFSLTLSA